MRIPSSNTVQSALKVLLQQADRAASAGDQARAYELIENVYAALDARSQAMNIDYRADWHADLDLLCAGGTANQYAAANPGG